ncbi:AAA family ATPase [Providencia manganoxydans]|uniref:AAA family ATPase n=1 Tax=Providencia manganoxydans TaxID=2923283 RepID=A0ABX7ABP2_9GAMM|nr:MULTISPECIES: AAA family ATPase [Providencia]MDX4947223.1 AAA family ATPase [Providencia manganoxydans]QQO61112.1 AAA family ATPase [Providencia manganoxydans]HEF8771298.1 AAA family ATPase [Providencia stuartii]
MNWQLSDTREWSQLEERFDFVRDMRGVPQDQQHHAEGDVATHTQMVLNALESLPEYQQLPALQQNIVWAAALLHDVEKRSTTREQDGRIRSPGHAKKGELSVRHILFREVETPFVIREQIAGLVRYHGLPLWVMEKADPERALFAASLRVAMPLLCLLAKADVLGRICADQAELLSRIELFELFCREQGCWEQPKAFASMAGRFHYFHQQRGSPDYQPFEEFGSEVIMLCGLPGMGKDHFIAQYYPHREVICLDEIRREHKISPADRNAQGWVAQYAKEQAKVRLRAKTDFIWNATSLSASLRESMISLFARYQAKIHLIYLEVPYKQWQQQNRQRKYAVPENVMERMANKLELPTPDEAHQVSYFINGEFQF